MSVDASNLTPSDVLRAQSIRDGLRSLGEAIPSDVAVLAALDPWAMTRAEDREPLVSAEPDGTLGSELRHSVEPGLLRFTVIDSTSDPATIEQLLAEVARSRSDLVARAMAPLLALFTERGPRKL